VELTTNLNAVPVPWQLASLKDGSKEEAGSY
jgi:hypothetical protein